jgi:hypothetical protein
MLFFGNKCGRHFLIKNESMKVGRAMSGKTQPYPVVDDFKTLLSGPFVRSLLHGPSYPYYNIAIGSGAFLAFLTDRSCRRGDGTRCDRRPV